MAITGLNRRMAPIKGAAGPRGPEGESAYKTAVRRGFVGTEDEWLETLVGPQGPEGPPGPMGPQGEPGIGIQIQGAVADESDLPESGVPVGHAYLIDGEIYVWNGNEWFNAGVIQGPEGPPGPEGPVGPEGPMGPPGPQPELEGSGTSDKAARSDHDHEGVYSEVGHRHDASDIDGMIDVSQLPVGTGAGTVAEGDHSHDEYALANHTHSQYALTSHVHDDRYFTKSETGNFLASKADANHNHNAAYSQRGHTHTILPATWLGASIAGRTINDADGTWITLYENEWGFSHATYALMWVIACEIYGDHGVTGNLRYRVTLNDGTPITSGAYQADQGVDSTKVWTFGNNLVHNRAGGQLKFKLEIQMISGVYTIRSGSWSLMVSPRMSATNAAP